MTDNRGFTLVELISVVLILSVLALIVYPSYRNYVEKDKCSAGSLVRKCTFYGKVLSAEWEI